jgi:hypothetical protein
VFSQEWETKELRDTELGSLYGRWKVGIPANPPADTLLEQLVNHNGNPSPGFSKVLIAKGFKFFRKNTYRSVDSALFIEHLNLDKSNT